MNREVMFSSASDEWETPQELFDTLNAEFDFHIDLAATAKNTKCNLFYSQASDALSAANDWSTRASWCKRGFCNPPYSRGLQKRFIEKAAAMRHRGFTTVMLLPARTDTVAFHNYIYNHLIWQPRLGVEIRFLKGRIKFGGAKNGAPFPSMIVVFHGR